MVRSQRDENFGFNCEEGVLYIDKADTIEYNGTNNVTISNVAPSGVGTATISKWLRVSINGVTYFIPLWT